MSRLRHDHESADGATWAVGNSYGLDRRETLADREDPGIACETLSDDLLLVDWLNALVCETATRRMLFSAFVVTIEDSRLHATAWGESVDQVRREPAVEVKGATCTALRAERLEAPGAYKDVAAMGDAADEAGLSKKVARLEPLVCIKG